GGAGILRALFVGVDQLIGIERPRAYILHGSRIHVRTQSRDHASATTVLSYATAGKDGIGGIEAGLWWCVDLGSVGYACGGSSLVHGLLRARARAKIIRLNAVTARQSDWSLGSDGPRGVDGRNVSNFHLRHTRGASRGKGQ